MRIKEVEENIGITRKNIRFYEKEGLLSPERNCENGYREYSENDIKKLKEIKLLRKLGIPIEAIHLLQSGCIELEAVLEKQLHNFNNEIDNLNVTKDFCMKIKKQNLSYKEVDPDLWLSNMRELEGRGTRFMNISNDEIIRFLPDKFKLQYYEAIIKNGQIDNALLGEILAYFEEAYKKSVNTEKLLIDILKRVNSDEKSELLRMIKENNSGLYGKISSNIFDFEDIVTLDKVQVKKALEQFNKQIIVKASMGASPKVNEYLKSLFPEIDFLSERNAIGSVPIAEIINIHDEIVKEINN
ncbi:MAG: putative transcriptional regulator [Clostridiales bacterium]|nr:putative transcriptional regulator [Clostridiales bacterium]